MIISCRFKGIVLGLLLLALLAGCRNPPGPVNPESSMQGALIPEAHGRPNRPPADLDTSLSQSSANGLFQVSITSHLEPLSVNQMHSWTLRVVSPEGDGVENALISIQHLMPEHGHGMPTEPEVTRDLGNGDYLVEGVKFNMRGWWVVDFTIEAGGEIDGVTFNFMIE
jgi:hypothetical protein